MPGFKPMANIALPPGRWVKAPGGIRRWVPAVVPDCGTREAFRRHLALVEVPCADCTEAERLAAGELGPNGRRYLPHGTHSAFFMHRKYGTEPCALCVRGEYVYQANRPNKGKSRSCVDCGTAIHSRSVRCNKHAQIYRAREAA